MRGRRVAAIAAAGLAVAAGSGVAIAATTGDSPKEREAAILDDAAGRLGVTHDKLRDALGAAQDAQLDAAVKRGDLTQEQADAIKERRADSGLVLGGPGGAPGFRHHGGPGFGFRFGAGHEVADAAAKALGLTRAELFERFRDGDTLAEIAKAEGKQLADVRAAVRAAAKTELDEAVKAGRLTQAQADDMLDELVEHFGAFPGGRGFHERGGGPGLGFHFGFGGEVTDAVAKALGISRDELFDRLRDGDTLAEIAKAEGKQLADVRAAARTAAKAELDEAVQDGRLTRQQANRLLDAISERIEQFPADRPFRHGP